MQQRWGAEPLIHVLTFVTCKLNLCGNSQGAASSALGLCPPLGWAGGEGAQGRVLGKLGWHSFGCGGLCPCPGLSSELLPCLQVLLWRKLHRHGPLCCVGREVGEEPAWRARMVPCHPAACSLLPWSQHRVPWSQSDPNKGCRGRAHHSKAWQLLRTLWCSPTGRPPQAWLR